MNNRIVYMDIARGIGILFIVLGHNDLAAYHPFLHKFVYAFHIPVFFFLSGAFFRAERAFGDFLVRRFNSLLKPYFFTIFLIYVMEASFGLMTFPVIWGRIVKSMYGTGHYIDWVQLWFIPHLFAVSLFAWLAWRGLFGRVKWDWLRWLLMFAMLAVGVLTMPYFWPFTAPVVNMELYGLPYSLDLVLASGFFFLLGYEVNQRRLERVFASPLFLAGTFIALLAMLYFLEPSIDFNTRTYPSLWINTIEALLGIGMVLSFSIHLEKWSAKLTALLSYLGRISLIILILHVPIQESIHGKLVRLGASTDLAIALAFLTSGILVPVFFYEFFIHRNPRLRPWFGFAVEEQSTVHREDAKTAKEI